MCLFGRFKSLGSYYKPVNKKLKNFKDPLLEDFTVLSKIWNLTSVDLCELARNSVLISSFPDSSKESWLGKHYSKFGCDGNDSSRTNLPQIRVAYRTETLLNELDLLLSS